jgi:predicted dehydrogenase
VGLCDASEEARRNALATVCLGEDRTFGDAREAIHRIRPQLVIIATTAPAHGPLVRLAAESGASHVLCEKPLATSLSECDAIVEACRARRVRLAVNHQMRFMEQYTLPKALLTDPSLGGLASMQVSAGNFGLAMNGTHYFEAFRFMAEDRPVLVNAWFSSEKVGNPRGPQFEDAAGSVRLETASGKRFYMDCSADQGHGMFVVYTGPRGRLTVDELAGEAVLVKRQRDHADLPTTRYGMPWETQRLTLTPADAVAPTRAVLSALIAGEGHPTGEDGRLAVEVLIAAHVSHRDGGRTVDLRREALPRDMSLPIA